MKKGQIPLLAGDFSKKIPTSVSAYLGRRGMSVLGLAEIPISMLTMGKCLHSCGVPKTSFFVLSNIYRKDKLPCWS